jgi:hypothetical protein
MSGLTAHSDKRERSKPSFTTMVGYVADRISDVGETRTRNKDRHCAAKAFFLGS